uniref:hypothetical protein n=2 Tax=Xanthomonas axonopodis TaxID=53413 RepID=UPI0006C7BDD6|nr:hypothetical protein [Xanthomonas axonopodis]
MPRCAVWQMLDAADAVFSERRVNAPLALVVARAGPGRATLVPDFRTDLPVTALVARGPWTA